MIAHPKAAALVLVLLSSAAFGQSDALQRGLELFRQEKYEAALQQFEEAKQAEPADASIENLIGITETKLGRIEEANTDYEAAVRLDPKLPGPRKNLAFNYLSAGKYDLAEKQLRIALIADGSDPFVHYYLVLVYLSAGRDRDALAHIRAAQPALENDPQAAFLATKVCLRSNDPAEALKLIASLEQHASLSAAQEYALAKALDDKRMYVESAERFRRIVQMQPGSWENQYNLAVALLRAKESAQAFPLLASMMAANSNDANILTKLASVYESAGNSPLALEAYRKAILADPQNPDRYLDCSRLLMDLNRYKEALDIVERGISNSRDDYPLTVRLGAVEMMMGDRAKAQETYRRAIAEHPEIPLGYVALAQSYMKEGDDQDALKTLAAGRAIVPRDFELEYVFGLASSKSGLQNQAMAAFKSAEQLDPNVVEPHYQLGIMYMKLQQWSNAQTEFNQVLKLDPHRAAAYYQLSRAYARTGQLEKAHQMAMLGSQLEQAEQADAIKAEKVRLGAPIQ